MTFYNIYDNIQKNNTTYIANQYIYIMCFMCLLMAGAYTDILKVNYTYGYHIQIH